MTPEQFCYWLQGYTEVHGGTPTEQQWRVIKDHLQEVFHKKTPNYQFGIVGGQTVPMPAIDSQIWPPIQPLKLPSTTGLANNPESLIC